MKIPIINTFYNKSFIAQSCSNYTLSSTGKRSQLSEINDEDIDDFKTSYDPLQIYISSIEKYDKISREEQIELAKKIQAGGEEAEKARARMIQGNLMLVVERAIKRNKKYQKLDIMDYIQEGNIALQQAVDKYNGKYAFSTFAVSYIDGYLKRAEEYQSTTIRLPSSVVQLRNNIFLAKNNFINKFNRKPTIEEISKELNQPVSKIKEALESPTTESLHKKISDDIELIDLIENKKVPSPRSSLEKSDLEENIKSLLNQLDERSREILIRHFGLFNNKPLNYSELSKIFKVSRQRIQAIAEAALKKLSEHPAEVTEYMND